MEKEDQIQVEPTIGPTMIKKIARLSRLEFSDENIANLTGDLANIVALVSQINQYPTDDIEPLAHPLEMSQRLRRDQPTESDQHERFQATAPQVEQGLYLVPRVIE